MLSRVDIGSDFGQTITLTLDDAADGYAVKDIAGLGPVKAALVSSSFAGFDGSQYQSSRRENRNITMKIGLEPNYETNTVRSLRDELYRFFMPESKVHLTFYMDSDEFQIDGYIESCEVVHFSEDPEVFVSIICFDPDYFGQEYSLVQSTVSDDSEFVVAYPGTAATGIEFTLYIDRSVTEFTIYNRTDDNVTRSLDFAANLVAGDVLTINTNPGSKFAKLLRDGTEIPVLYGISPQATWLQLLNGDNNLSVYAVGAPMTYTLLYTTRFGGL